MSSISICLIEKNAFFRAGIKSFLEDTNFHISCSYSDFPALSQLQKIQDEIDLVMIGIEENIHDIETIILDIRKVFKNSRIATLNTETDWQRVISFFEAGVDGCLLRNMTPPALIGSLNMMMAGEKVFPTILLEILAKQTGGNEKTNIVAPVHSLSSREVQVLKYLAGGDTNKQIARVLDITEATVKVHIKTVLRKLDLSNRTQAAVWAVNKGLIIQEPHFHQTGNL